ncbi:copper resistance CopC family protein [Nocardioides bruguierae]|uniref:copper resistance CopC family protein n=1 Tax=Nocardioides bruguierae TaxID=2945102 RepID=UPI0020200FD4|nr:copper resistance CopC family protein [Nocardioides bruguierae]MCL8024981.1 copper resistance protein CopC [Nocardioides bruguierae]
MTPAHHLSHPARAGLARTGAAGLLVSLLVSLLAALLLTVGAAPASAHASLIGTDPEDGASLDALPTSVTFEFSEEMSDPAYVVVTAPDGSEVADGDPVVSDNLVTQALLDGPAGAYTMAYRVVSADGHPVSGQISFTVAAGETASPSASASASTSASASASASPSAPATSAEATTDGATESTPSTEDDGSWLSRNALTVGVPVVLVLLAGGLLLLSRRSSS